VVQRAARWGATVRGVVPRNDASRPSASTTPTAVYAGGVRVVVVVLAGDDVVAEVKHTLSATSAQIVRASSVADIASVKEPAAVVVGQDVSDGDVGRLARRLLPEERHRLLVLRHGHDVSTDVPWTVLRTSELSRTLPLLVEEAEAVVVELLASVKDASHPGLPGRYACVVSVASAFVIVAIDAPPESPLLAFVLPGAGRLAVQGALSPVFGRPGLWRLSPDDESVRAALKAFTLRRADEGIPA